MDVTMVRNEEVVVESIDLRVRNKGPFIRLAEFFFINGLQRPSHVTAAID